MKPWINKELGIRIRLAEERDTKEIKELLKKAKKEIGVIRTRLKKKNKSAAKHLIAETLIDKKIVGIFPFCKIKEEGKYKYWIATVFVLKEKRNNYIFKAMMIRFLYNILEELDRIMCISTKMLNLTLQMKMSDLAKK